MPALYPVLLWAVLALLLLAASRRAASLLNVRPLRAAGDAAVQLSRRAYWPLLAAVFALALFLRLYGFPDIPANYHTDGILSAVDGYALARFGTDHYGTSYPAMMEAWGYGQQSAMMAYLMSLSTRLFGLTRVGVRLPTMLISLAGLAVFYDFARRLCGRSYALLALFLLAVSPWHIQQSRQALDAYMLCHFLLFSMDLLVLGLRRRPALYLSMVFFALSMYCYGVAAYVVPPLLICCCAYLLARRFVRVRDVLVCALIFFVVSLPVVLTLCINAFGWETVQLGPITCQRFEESTRSSDILFFTQEPFMDRLFANLLCALRVTFWQSAQALGTDARFGAVYPFSAPLLAAGLLLLWRHRRTADLTRASGSLEPRAGFLLLCWTLCAFASCVITNSVTAWRANAIYYPLVLLAAYAVYWACRRVRAFIPAFAAVYLAALCVFFPTYIAENREAVDSQDSPAGQYEALAYVRDLPFEHLYFDAGAPEGADYYIYDAPTVRLLYVFGLSPAQFNEEAPILSCEGEDIGLYGDVFELWPPEYGADYLPDPEENAAYVIPAANLEQFDPEAFHIEVFHTYAAVYPQAMMPSTQEGQP